LILLFAANLFPKLLASGKLTSQQIIDHIGKEQTTKLKIPDQGVYFFIIPKYDLDLETAFANHKRKMRLD